MKNKNLSSAKKAKNDEFYTQLSDIENELQHYKDHFKGKVIYCNCDDPEESNFWKYFELNFEFLGLKKLIATHFHTDRQTYKLEIIGDINGDGKVNKADIIKTVLSGNGDFRSPECVELLKECDIVVTNPPFSLFREFIDLMFEYNKKFIVLGNNNAITYKEVFKHIKENRLWLGVNSNKTMEFRLHSDYEKWNRIDEEGNKYGNVPAISWFTNLEHSVRNQLLEPKSLYQGNELKYPKYDNYDAIEVSRVKEIPMDYDGVMGVPITFLSKYNPNEFEILDANDFRIGEKIKDLTARPFINGKEVYRRILIKHKTK
jgi:hypothetical protein